MMRATHLLGVLFFIFWRAAAEFPVDQQCPDDCDCHYFRVNYVTDCSESNFTEIPHDEISTNVYILNMNGNELETFSDWKDDIKLRRLQLAENKIPEINSTMFKGLKYMIEIDLSSNLIEEIDPHAFKDSPGLITIELQNNPLKHFDSGPIFYAPSLRYLDVSNCGLYNLSSDFFDDVPNLTVLDMSGNPLLSVSTRLFRALVRIDEIKLSNCNLTYLEPDFLNQATLLKTLDVSKNNFKDVDWRSIVSQLPRLETMNLERCGLTNLPDNIFGENTWIRNLDVSDNDLSDTDIGSALRDNLKHLIFLDLGNCNLQSLNENSFSSAENLRTLYLCNNDLQPRELLRALVPLQTLNKLSLRNCSLTKLPKNIFENLTELRDLDVSWNPLNNVFEELLQPLQNLEFLDMGYSNLKKLAKNTFTQTGNLKKLVLSGNKLGDLENGLFKDLSMLATLEINNCGLEQPLGEDVFTNETYAHLQELRMSGNPLKILNEPLIPEALCNLRILDISNCSLKNLTQASLKFAPNLERLLLNNNQLVDAVLKDPLFESGLSHLMYIDLSSNNFTSIMPVDFARKMDLTDIKLTNNPWICDCKIHDWWNWALQKGDVKHLIGAALTEDDIRHVGGGKKKRGLLCTVDPAKSPLSPRKTTARKVRVEVATKPWARYLKESSCNVKVVSTTTPRPTTLFPDPILPSPGLPHYQGLSDDEGTQKTSLAVVGGVSALLLAVVVALGVSYHRRRTNQPTIELSSAPSKS